MKIIGGEKSMNNELSSLITQLQKVRKQCYKLSLKLKEDILISNCLSGASYTITVAIKDIVRVIRTLKERNKNEKQIPKTPHCS